jgi:rhodanese-related sulfurtransferase
MTTRVTATAAAPSNLAIKHFEEMLAFETDCWDVHESLKSPSPDFIVVDVRGTTAFAKGHVANAINIHLRTSRSLIATNSQGGACKIAPASPNLPPMSYGAGGVYLVILAPQLERPLLCYNRKIQSAWLAVEPKSRPSIREAAFASLKAPLRPVRAPVDPTDAREEREASGRWRIALYDSRKTTARPARNSS